MNKQNCENKNRLTKKEKLFCCAYASSGDMTKSAELAGFCVNPRSEAIGLLSRECITDEISRLIRQRESLFSSLALIGYQRLAFGSVSDAVRLVCAESLSELKLDDMDLFLVSEIKKPKDGSMEIKFFDRLKALEKLGSVEKDSTDSFGIFDAISKSADLLGGDDNAD